MRRGILVIVFITVALTTAGGCKGCRQDTAGDSGPLRGAASYTPYDAHAMLWTRVGESRNMVWVSSGAEAGTLLVSQADAARRPDWILCSQGVVAGLAAKGEDVVILATVYVSDDVLVPVFRKPRGPLEGRRSLFIPRSSIELAFDRLLKREGIERGKVRVPNVEKVGFATIVALLSKPGDAPDALDFAILVDPYVSNLVREQPEKYEIGKGGLYELHYCIVARRGDVQAHRGKFLDLLRQMLEADKKLASLSDDDAFYKEVWGREQGGLPDVLPRMLTYRRGPARLEFQVTSLRNRLQEELQYLTDKYPDQLRMPADINVLADPSLMEEVAADRVTR